MTLTSEAGKGSVFTIRLPGGARLNAIPPRVRVRLWAGSSQLAWAHCNVEACSSPAAAWAIPIGARLATPIASSRPRSPANLAVQGTGTNPN